MKSLSNILLLLILTFSLSTMPLFLSPIDYSSSIDFEEKVSERKLEIKSVSGTSLNNPENISLEISFNGDMNLTNVKDSLFSISIYKDSSLIKTLNSNVLSHSAFENDVFHLNSDNSFRASLSLSQKELSLANGSYRILIAPKIPELLSQQIELKVSYSLDGKYINASNEAPSNTLGLTYYLSDENDALIPVTGFFPKTSQSHKALLEAYSNESTVPNLINPMGEINYIISRDNTIYIDIPKDDLIYNLPNKKAQNAYWAFVKTFSNIDGIRRVRFTVDNLVLEEFFYGKNIRYAIEYNKENKIYLPILVEERYYLSDVSISTSETMNQEEIFEFITNSIKDYFRVKYSYIISNSTIEITFDPSLSKEITEEDKLDMLIESMLFSYSSIPGINSLKISTIESMDNIGSYSFEEALQPPIYINPIE
jgi:hypothetical protein